jgi:hypothetical protein
LQKLPKGHDFHVKNAKDFCKKIIIENTRKALEFSKSTAQK